MQVFTYETERDVAARAEAEVFATAEGVGGGAIAIPTGKTPLAMYELLVQRCLNGCGALQQVRWFALDEFAGLEPGSSGVYRRLLLERFIGPAGLPGGNLETPRSDAPDPEAEAARYEGRIKQAGGLDLAVLGLGLNGHLGFNEPGTPIDSLTGLRRLEAPSRESNAYLFPDGSVPPFAISMGLGTILAARRILLLVTGAHKAGIVRRLIKGEEDPGVCPATLLRRHPDAMVLLDRAAAGEL